MSAHQGIFSSSLIFLIYITPPATAEYMCTKIRDLREAILTHGVTFTFVFTETIAHQCITLNKLQHQGKNHQHWSVTLERKVHRLFSKNVCGKHYVIKMYCFIFIHSVGGVDSWLGGRHPLVFSSEWCVTVRRGWVEVSRSQTFKWRNEGLFGPSQAAHLQLSCKRKKLTNLSSS